MELARAGAQRGPDEKPTSASYFRQTGMDLATWIFCFSFKNIKLCEFFPWHAFCVNAPTNPLNGAAAMPQPNFPRRQSGFTLIEIAIVLVIIGLLLGGILKGQELINSARVKNLATDFRNIPMFIYSYQDKFRALPGDDPAVTTHVTGGTLATTPKDSQGNGVIDGTWDSTTATDESYLFWQHVRLAGLAPGVTAVDADGYRPTNASGGFIGVQSGTTEADSTPVKDAGGTAIRGTYVICSSGIIGKYAKQLDIQMDDGNTAEGSMMATPTTGYAIGAAATATDDIDDAAPYTVCMGI
jgi:prepilin-type N-terminal cleavage/methylation domain-containing protein